MDGPPAARMRPGTVCCSMLNLPSQPGTTGFLLLGLGAAAGLALLVFGRAHVRGRLAPDAGHSLTSIVTVGLAVSVASAPFTTWRVLEDIRRTAPITAEHARYVGAETKLIDGELVERIAALVPADQTYHVAVDPRAYVEIRESLALWMGYALVPRRQARAPESADWIVTWGATPSRLGLRAREPRLVGRNRLADDEPVYLARASP